MRKELKRRRIGIPCDRRPKHKRRPQLRDSSFLSLSPSSSSLQPFISLVFASVFGIISPCRLPLPPYKLSSPWYLLLYLVSSLLVASIFFGIHNFLLSLISMKDSRQSPGRCLIPEIIAILQAESFEWLSQGYHVSDRPKYCHQWENAPDRKTCPGQTSKISVFAPFRPVLLRFYVSPVKLAVCQWYLLGRDGHQLFAKFARSKIPDRWCTRKCKIDLDLNF